MWTAVAAAKWEVLCTVLHSSVHGSMHVGTKAWQASQAWQRGQLGGTDDGARPPNS